MITEEYFKDQYFYELGRRDRLVRELSLPFGLVAVIAGATVSLIGRISRPIEAADYIVIPLVGGLAVSLVITAFLLWFSWAEHPYKYPATSDEVKKYGQELKKHFEKFGTQNAEENATASLESFILSEYIRCASKNATTNDNRAKYVKWVKRGVLVCTGFAFFGYTISILDQLAIF